MWNLAFHIEGVGEQGAGGNICIEGRGTIRVDKTTYQEDVAWFVLLMDDDDDDDGGLVIAPRMMMMKWGTEGKKER